MNVPSAQSKSETPHTPHAMLMPDQGTTPMRRSKDRRTQAGDCAFLPAASASAPPSSAVRVSESTRGKNCVMSGASGIASSVADSEPSVVSVVRSSVAEAGLNNAPASTFCRDVRLKLVV